jgi:hypothetical protein
MLLVYMFVFRLRRCFILVESVLNSASNLLAIRLKHPRISVFTLQMKACVYWHLPHCPVQASVTNFILP